jgi:hypothetical protein
MKVFQIGQSIGANVALRPTFAFFAKRHRFFSFRRALTGLSPLRIFWLPKVRSISFFVGGIAEQIVEF